MRSTSRRTGALIGCQRIKTLVREKNGATTIPCVGDHPGRVGSGADSAIPNKYAPAAAAAADQSQITDTVKFYDSKLVAWRPVLVVALMTFGMAACSTSDPQSSAIKDSTSPKSPGLTTTTLGPVSPGQPPTTIAGGVPLAPIAPTTTLTTAPIGPPCGNSELAVSIQTGFEGAGSASEELGFRNVGQSPCTLYGYPGVAALNAQGQQIVQGDRNGDLPSAVGLQPGAIAASLVSGSDGSLPQCAGLHTDSFLVTPPNLTHSVEVAAANSFGSIAISCGIDISPVTPEPPQPIPAGASSTTSG